MRGITEANPRSFRFTHGRELFARFGSHALAYATLQPGMEYRHWPGVGYVAYQTVRRPRGITSIVLGDPVCSKTNLPCILEDTCASLPDPFFMQVGAQTAASLASEGLCVDKCGIEVEVGLPDWNIAGRQRRTLRNALNRVTSLRFERCTMAECGDAYSAMESLSNRWRAQRRIFQHELRFLSRPITFDADPWVKVIHAWNAEKLEGYIMLDPIFQDGHAVGYTGHARVDPIAKDGLSDALFCRAIDWARESGAQRFSVGWCPFAGHDAGSSEPCTITEALAKFMFKRCNWIYNFRGQALHKGRYLGNAIQAYMAGKNRLPLRQLHRVLIACGMASLRWNILLRFATKIGYATAKSG